MRTPRLIGITVVKDEADIIEQTLRHSAGLLDLVIVVDCGSTDGTIERIQAVEREAPHVVLAQCLPPTMPEDVRPHIWNPLRPHLRSSDWWIIVDGDEFLDPEVREKCRRAAAEGADHLFSAHANFYYKRSEAQAWREGRETLADRQRPIQERRRYYRMHTSMPRAFRNLPWLRWTPASYMPEMLARPGTEAIEYRHFQYRDLAQLEVRMRNRASVDPGSALGRENPHWLHSAVDDFLSPDDDPHLRTYDGYGALIRDEAFPVIPHPSRVKSLAKRLLGILRGYLLPSGDERPLFEIDGRQLIARLR